MKNNFNKEKQITFTETEILEQLDLAFNYTPSKYFLAEKPEDIKSCNSSPFNRILLVGKFIFPSYI